MYGICTYMKGWFLLGKLVGKYTIPMDPMATWLLSPSLNKKDSKILATAPCYEKNISP